MNRRSVKEMCGEILGKCKKNTERKITDDKGLFARFLDIKHIPIYLIHSKSLNLSTHLT